MQEIAPNGFCRTHRSFAVNLDYVESIETHGSGSSEVTLKNGTVIPLSRRWYDELKGGPFECELRACAREIIPFTDHPGGYIALIAFEVMTATDKKLICRKKHWEI